MASIFEQTIVPKIPFSNFDLSETQLISHGFGQLIPCYVREVLPNDVFKMACFADSEFAPMVAPMKHNCHISVHFFYVPNRIVFDDWETFITGSEDGHALTTEAELARMPSQPGFKIMEAPSLLDDGAINAEGSLLDYLGLPNDIVNVNNDAPSELLNTVISDIPLRDYFKIWYDYYRDENLQATFLRQNGDEATYYDFWRRWRSRSETIDPEHEYDFVDAVNFGMPYYRAYKKDYFTGALQSPQKGEPVTINLGVEAPVVLNTQNVRLAKPSAATGPSYVGPQFNLANGFSAATNDQQILFTTGPTNFAQGQIYADGESHTVQSIDADLQSKDVTTQEYVSQLNGVADLSKASAITVEALREAFAVQEILESLSLRGSRYTEFLRGNFGVTPDDYRLQRPQFLGGIVSPVAVQRVTQTSGYSGESTRDMTGYAAGRAFAAAGQRIFSQRFKEYGYIIGIMSVMPQAYYYQGIPRHYLRNDRFDYYMVQTAHLGEQPIQNIELFLQTGDENTSLNVFGFIPRWAEYKIATNGIHGDFRGSLNYYHMAREFAQNNVPTLSKEFISTEGLQTRPFAYWSTEHPEINHLIWTTLFFKVIASRPIPYHSIPKVQ